MATQETLRRQGQLLTRLDGNGATIRRLASRLKVSEKTIRRDLNTLRHVGFPISEIVGEFGCKTFVLQSGQSPQVNFTYDEALALFLSRRSMESWRGSFVWEAMEHGFAQIRAALGDKVANYVGRLAPRFQTTGLHPNYEGKGDLINQLTLAIEECKATFISLGEAIVGRSQRDIHSTTKQTTALEPIASHGRPSGADSKDWASESRG